MRRVIQAANLLTILGIAVGPQIARPFLGHEVYRPASNDTATNSTLLEQLDPIQMVYLLMGLLTAAMAAACLSTCVCSCISGGEGVSGCFSDSGPEDADDIQIIPGGDSASSESPKDSDAQPPDKLEPCSRYGCTLILITVLFGVLNGGYAVILTGLLFTYVHEYLEWSVRVGTALLTIKDSIRLVSSGVVMFLVSKQYVVSPTRQTFFNLVALIVSSALMSAAQLVDGVGALTVVGVVVAGLGSYNMCSTIVAAVDEAVHVRAHVLVTIYSSFGTGSLLLPPVSGALLMQTGAVSYPLLLLALTISGLALFIVYAVLSRRVKANST